MRPRTEVWPQAGPGVDHRRDGLNKAGPQGQSPRTDAGEEGLGHGDPQRVVSPRVVSFTVRKHDESTAEACRNDHREATGLGRCPVDGIEFTGIHLSTLGFGILRFIDHA